MKILTNAELEIYNECLEKIVKYYNSIFKILKRTEKNFQKRMYPLPKRNNITTIQCQSNNIELSKVFDDPFDITYTVSITVMQKNFDKVVGTCMKNAGLEFDISARINKEEFLKDFVFLIKKVHNLDFDIIEKGKKIVFQFNVLLTETENIDL